MKRKAKRIAELEAVNQENKYLIQILSDAMNRPGNRGRLYNMICQACPFFTEQQQGEVGDSGKHDRIQELEREIEAQTAAHEKLEKQLLDYNEKAKQYEEMIAKNEKEKADLLASFERHANATQSNDTSLAFKALETKAEGLASECERMRQQSNEARQLCRDIHSALKKSRGECKSLEQQIKSAKRQLRSKGKGVNDEKLKEQIAEQDRLITELTSEIDSTDKEIARLKEENQNLRERLLQSTTEE